MSHDGITLPLSFSGHEAPYSIFSDQSPQDNKHSAEEKLSHKLSTGQNAASTSEKMLGLVFPVLTLKRHDGTLVHSKEALAQTIWLDLNRARSRKSMRILT